MFSTGFATIPEGIAEETKKLNNEAKLSPIDGFKFDPAGWEDVIANITAVRTEYNDAHVYEDSATRYDAYQEKLENAGLSDLIEAVQEQLDAFLAEKNK